MNRKLRTKNVEELILFNKPAPFRPVLDWLAADPPPIRMTELRDFLIALANRRRHARELRVVFAELARLALPYSALGQAFALRSGKSL